uniref:Uncharacterized protein n=1 Tax=Avena sativa TaxID=4498 RepID=A0ACD6ABR4_AVESA
MEAHQIKKCMVQMILLAGPGVLMSTFLLGTALKLTFPYDWDWKISLLLGGLLSASDPVAVVAHLKELGTSKKLSTIIEGESLMNDGVSVVVYQLFYRMVLGRSFNAESIMIFLTEVSLGGVALGLAFGIISLLWLGCIFNDTILEMTLTLAVSYLAFYTVPHCCSSYLGTESSICYLAQTDYFHVESISYVMWTSQRLSSMYSLDPILSHGSTLGLYEVLTGKPYICNMIADSFVRCFFIEAEKIDQLRWSDPSVEALLWQESALVVAKLLIPRVFERITTHETRLVIAKGSTMSFYTEGEDIVLEHNQIGILLEGLAKAKHRPGVTWSTAFRHKRFGLLLCSQQL